MTVTKCSTFLSVSVIKKKILIKSSLVKERAYSAHSSQLESISEGKSGREAHSYLYHTKSQEGGAGRYSTPLARELTPKPRNTAETIEEGCLLAYTGWYLASLLIPERTGSYVNEQSDSSPQTEI